MLVVINLLLSTIAVVVAAYLLPGVHVDGFLTALAVAIVLGVVNTIIKPVLFFLTLPVTILTLGLFSLVINGLMVLLVSSVVPGFYVDGFGWAILFSIVLSLISGFMSMLR